MTKNDLVQKIIQAAKDYQTELVGRTFMYVFNNHQIEVTYKKSNFCHLTGVTTRLSAEDFFDKAHKGTLAEKEITFTKHPFKDVKKKVNDLLNMPKMVTSECIMLESISTKSIILKYGVTNMIFSVGFDLDTNVAGGQPNYYFPRSLRKGDSVDISRDIYSVSHIFCKRSDKKKYNTPLYIDKSATLCGLPNEIKDKLSSHLQKGERFVDSCLYLFKESSDILSENPELNSEFIKLRQKYLAANNLKEMPQITDDMPYADKFKAAEDYYTVLNGIIVSDSTFKAKYVAARDKHRESQKPLQNLTGSLAKQQTATPKPKHKR